MLKKNCPKRRFSSKQRIALFLRARGRCAICDAPLAPNWHADHVRAWSRGGDTDAINGQAACPACNLRKSDKELNDRE